MALVGRDALLATLGEDIAGSRSVLLTGPRGSGRTAVLEAVADLGPAGRTTTVAGRERHVGVPFSPWGRVLAEHDARLDEPLSLYTELPVRIASRLDLLLVDDLDLLDPASALLTVQVARAGVTVVATTHETALVPDSLRDLVRRWRRREVALLTDRELETVAAHTLGGPLTAPSAARMAAWASGRPAIVVALAEAARAAGQVSPTAGGLRVGDPVVGDDVLDYLDVDAEAARQARARLEPIAVAGRLPRAFLDTDEQLRLTRLHLVRCDDEDVALATPLLAAWVLRGMTAGHREQLYAVAATLVRAHDPDDGRARVLEACARRGGALTEVVDAAAWLASEDRLAEAASLLEACRPAPHDAPEQRWRWCLARARVHRDLDDPAAAVAALDDAVEHAADDAQLVQLVSTLGSVLGGLIDEDDRLEERIDRILPLIVDDRARASVRAILSRRRAILGERGPDSNTAGEPGLTDPIVTLLREAMGGSLEFAREHFIPPSAEPAVGEEEDLDELLQVLGRFLGLVYDGALVAGRAEADRRHQEALEAARPSLGLWSYNRAKIAFHAGQYDLAVVRGREMRRHLAWRDVAGQRLPGEALLAAALARQGEHDEAADLVAGLGREERALPRVLLGVRRVEAEALLEAGDRPAAAALLHDAGRYALAAGEGHSGLLAVDEAFMIDPTPAHAAALRELADQSGIAAAAADRAAALLAEDADALEQSARRFEAMPLPGRAAQAWEWAAAVHARAGRSEAHRRCAANAVLLGSRYALAPWPDRTTPRLTGRELEIARLAAERIRSREIADRLGLSVRTVDNHLARVFRKLGVSRREDLVSVL